MMVHDRVQDLASAALDFDLTPAERAELIDHLGSCVACAGFAAGLQHDVEAASAWPTFDVPVRVRQTVFAALDGAETISQPRAVARLSLALVLVLAMLALLAVVIGSSRGPSGLLAVVEGDTLYTLDPSSLQRSIVATVSPLPSGQFQWPVRWSANGWQLFLADGRAVNADGTHAIEAPYPGAEWSPDGSRYAVQYFNNRISIVDPSGVRPATSIALPPDVGYVVGRTMWSPDGRSLAFVGCSPECGGSDWPNLTYTLWIVAVDGPPARRLTELGTNLLSIASWSPDGTRISYTSMGLEPYKPACRTPIPVPDADRLCLVQSRLFVTKIADGSTQEIGSPPTMTGLAAWSPDGQRLAFQINDPDGTYRLATANADGSGLRRVSAGPFDGALPVWSGDGRWLAYATTRSPTSTVPTDYDVWIIRADGSGARMVAAGTMVFDWQPSQ